MNRGTPLFWYQSTSSVLLVDASKSVSPSPSTSAAKTLRVEWTVDCTCAVQVSESPLAFSYQITLLSRFEPHATSIAPSPSMSSATQPQGPSWAVVMMFSAKDSPVPSFCLRAV